MDELLDELFRKVEGLRKEGRVDVVQLAKAAGLKVKPMEDFTEIFDKSAYIQKDNGSYSIFVNPIQSKQRQRFSIAHEISHFFLHRDQLEKLRVIDRENGNSLSPTEESAADNTAAEILMPYDDIVETLNKKGVYEGAKITKDVVEALCKRYDVSFPAMVVRLRSMNKYYVPYINAYDS